MIVINVTVVDILKEDEILDDFSENYGFDLRKDLKVCELTNKDYNRIIKDLVEDVKNLPHSCKGDKLFQYNHSAIYKFRYKDEKRSIGTRSAYRFIVLLFCNEKVFPFHIYHKKSGKKPKLDLSENEKESIKKIVLDIEGD